MPLRLDPSLDGRLATMAAGRVLVVDAFRSWQCGTWVGDLTCAWWRTPPGGGYERVATLDGVPIHVQRRLLGLLEAAGARLVRRRLSPFTGVGIELDRPELWIDHLDRRTPWSGSAPERT